LSLGSPSSQDSSADPGSRSQRQAVRSYVLRAGRMTEAQRRAIEELGPLYTLPFDDKPLKPSGIFPEPKPLILEIGFGMGLATWQIALGRPEFNYLGVEVHSPGVGRLLMEIRDRGISNLKIIQHDAVEVLQAMIAPGGLAGLHIFYPDPWPKKRHHKRRLMRPALVDLMASRLAPGAYLYFVTDIEDYANQTMEVLGACGALKNAYEAFAPKMEWRPRTKFEGRAMKESRPCFELFFVKA
jgi:tRNA (guanine-N7-)-methyltransferase